MVIGCTELSGRRYVKMIIFTHRATFENVTAILSENVFASLLST